MISTRNLMAIHFLMVGYQLDDQNGCLTKHPFKNGCLGYQVGRLFCHLKPRTKEFLTGFLSKTPLHLLDDLNPFQRSNLGLSWAWSEDVWLIHTICNPKNSDPSTVAILRTRTPAIRVQTLPLEGLRMLWVGYIYIYALIIYFWIGSVYLPWDGSLPGCGFPITTRRFRRSLKLHTRWGGNSHPSGPFRWRWMSAFPAMFAESISPSRIQSFPSPEARGSPFVFECVTVFFWFNPSGDGCKKQKPKSVGAKMCSNKRGEEVTIFDSSIKLAPLKRSCVSLPIIILLSTFWDVFQEFVLWVANFFVLFKLVHGNLWVIGVFLRWIRLTHDRVQQFHYSLANFCCHGNLTPTCFCEFHDGNCTASVMKKNQSSIPV